MKKKAIGIIIFLLAVTTVLAVTFKDKGLGKINAKTGYSIIQKWDLPDELKEVSGIEWLGDNKIAAVQDEDGIIFIYNLTTSEIENQFSFGGNGDYEGIAINEGTAYILKSDGTILEISDYSKNPKVKTYSTPLSKVKGIDVEGLTWDKKNNTLLVAEKERKAEKKKKSIYSFDLQSKNSVEKPIFEIDLNDDFFKNSESRKKIKFNPSEIEIEPTSGDIYVLDGRNPKLLILDKNGKPEQIFFLNASTFAQPEGITFSPDGTLYISNEAGDGPANILQIKLEK
ncbi:MAG TPA: SdiA-regulated domain-containing protein [Salinimicrobium sp.]|nr:SdiA-regulated domain-containing protein [Salinimicrobium sp.]